MFGDLVQSAPADASKTNEVSTSADGGATAPAKSSGTGDSGTPVPADFEEQLTPEGPDSGVAKLR